MVDLWSWLTGLVYSYGYFGAFIVCIIGNLSILIPVPFALVIYIFGSVLNPLILGLIGGFGSTMGESVSYIIGRGGRRVIESRYGERLESVKKLIGKYGVIAIFLFALLPLPDDIILIPLGMMRYDWRRVLVSMWIGKTIMCTVLAYAGFYSFSALKDHFEAGGVYGVILSMVLLIVVIIVLLRIDWVKVAEDLEKRGL